MITTVIKHNTNAIIPTKRKAYETDAHGCKFSFFAVPSESFESIRKEDRRTPFESPWDFVDDIIAVR